MKNSVSYLRQPDHDAVLSSLKERQLCKNNLKSTAARFVLQPALEEAINTALTVSDPLLLTGEPGTGKTQTAYYVAWKLGLGDVLHFQVKSDSTAQDLLYHFDSVRYFHDAHIRAERNLKKGDYVEKRPLLEALQSEIPRVLLIDEIDKAPRDFPNDLLHELDQMSFTIKETGETISAQAQSRPLIFITSNNERRLPEAFLRRCVFYHIEFKYDLIKKIVDSHRESFCHFSDDFLELVINRFLNLRREPLRKFPATSELLVWLNMLAADAGTSPQRLEELFNLLSDDQWTLPYLSALLKNREDFNLLQRHGATV